MYFNFILNMIISLRNINNNNLLTLTTLSSVLSYIRSYSSLMVPRSISDRLTMIRISVVSSVPAPAIASCRRLAKNAGGHWTHSTGNHKSRYDSYKNVFIRWDQLIIIKQKVNYDYKQLILCVKDYIYFMP